MITEDVYTQIETRELARLRAIEAAALRVAGSRRSRKGGGSNICDAKTLDRLDEALEARS
jgi:hypothetical protein